MIVSEDPVARLGDEYVGFALSLPRHYQLLFLTPAKHAHDSADGASRPAGIEGYRLLVQTVTECIDTGRFRADLKDAHVVAQAIWSAVHGLVSLLIVMGEHEEFHWRSSSKLVEVTLGSLVGGMLANPVAEARRPRHKAPRKKSAR